VIECAAAPDLVEGLKRTLLRIEREHGLGHAKTSFEGLKTVRINNLLTYDDLFWEVRLHQKVLAVVEQMLDRDTPLCNCASEVRAEPVIGPRFARTRWRAAERQQCVS
jgi:hypothetical protein